jgi:hypothetical protein
MIHGAKTNQNPADRGARSTRIRRSLAMLGTAGALAAATLFAAPAAHADSSISIPGGAGAAEFQSYGELFTVHDYQSDGYATVGYLYSYDTGSSYTCLNTNGAAGAAKTCDYEFAENSLVSYQVCKYKASTGPVGCSGVVYDYA